MQPTQYIWYIRIGYIIRTWTPLTHIRHMCHVHPTRLSCPSVCPSIRSVRLFVCRVLCLTSLSVCVMCDVNVWCSCSHCDTIVRTHRTRTFFQPQATTVIRCDIPSPTNTHSCIYAKHRRWSDVCDMPHIVCATRLLWCVREIRNAINHYVYRSWSTHSCGIFYLAECLYMCLWVLCNVSSRC